MLKLRLKIKSMFSKNCIFKLYDQQKNTNLLLKLKKYKLKKLKSFKFL